MNNIASQIYESSLKISVLLHTLTFKIKGKHIPIKKKLIIEYIKYINNPEFIKVAECINIKRNNIILSNLYNYFSNNIRF